MRKRLTVFLMVSFGLSWGVWAVAGIPTMMLAALCWYGLSRVAPQP